MGNGSLFYARTNRGALLGISIELGSFTDKVALERSSRCEGILNGCDIRGMSTPLSVLASRRFWRAKRLGAGSAVGRMKLEDTNSESNRLQPVVSVLQSVV